MQMIQIIQYRNKCIGCYACAEASYSRCRMSRKDGKSVLIGGKKVKDTYLITVGDDELEENKKAVVNCPVNCIQIKKL